MIDIKPLISIITPVYNSEIFLKDTFRSVKNQTYYNWEWLLIDDCSTDKSWDILLSFANDDNRIKVFKNTTNMKAGKSRNFLIKKARGKFITFIDSDDIWSLDRLKIHSEFMLTNNISFSHSSYAFIDKKGNSIKKPFIVSDKPITYYDLLKKPEISCLTAMYDQKTLGKRYMSSHSKKQDYALWLSILREGIKSHPFKEITAYYRQHEKSNTSNKFSLILYHIKFLKETQNFNYFNAVYYTVYWGLNGLKKYFINK